MKSEAPSSPLVSWGQCEVFLCLVCMLTSRAPPQTIMWFGGMFKMYVSDIIVYMSFLNLLFPFDILYLRQSTVIKVQQIRSTAIECSILWRPHSWTCSFSWEELGCFCFNAVTRNAVLSVSFGLPVHMCENFFRVNT